MTDTPTYLLAMEALSIVAVTFSTIFLIITLILHLGSWQVSFVHAVSCYLILKHLCLSLHRRVRNELHVQLFINLCIALLLFYLVYIGAQYARSEETVCIIFSTFFHYAFLVVLIAILGEVTFVLLQGTWSPTKYYVIMAVVISWGKSHI